MSHTIKLGVLLSGGGTTLQNLADAIGAGTLPASIACVIASNGKAFGLTRAANLNLPAYTVARRDYADAGAFSERISALLQQHDVDLVILAGFLALWTIPDVYLGPLARGGTGALPRVMNIHPALLPKFGGKGMYGHHVHEAVIRAGETESGCTVHFCDNTYDTGPIILQRRCPVLPGDTPDALAARVFQQECIAYPEAIRLYAAGRLALEGGKVAIR